MTRQEIHTLRLTLGLTQNEFAQRVGVSSFVIVSRWETGAHKPSRMALQRLRALAERTKKGVRE